MDQNSKDSHDNPENERSPNSNAVNETMSEDDLDLFHDDSSYLPVTSPSETHHCTPPDMDDDTLFDSLSEGISSEECDCSPELHERRQYVPCPEMSTPIFDESAFIMPEIPINRPNCPVPNIQTFMPPHVFNPGMFPKPASTPCNFAPIVTNVQNSELGVPDSNLMPENRQLIHPVPRSHLNFCLSNMQQGGNPPAMPQRVFDINEPGPSHGRMNPMPGGLSTVPPLAPLTVELSSRQMSKIHGELRRVSTIFSRLVTIAHRKSCAPLPRSIRARRNPFRRTTGGPSNMERPNNTNVSDCGPTKAKQLKTKEVPAKTSTPKAMDVQQSPAAASNFGLLTIAPPTVQPTNGKPSNLTLAILKPSMLTYHGSRDAIIQTDPPKGNSNAGTFRRESSSDSDDDDLDENSNITTPKPNLKRRHPENN
ncbi:hypothetical protein CBL_13046 [Carabus blaptoides fortunei]